ncbi:hypothetical protein EJF36_07015 [Bacillus sp. HMF5848]|uniref:hypothetical protein n=1 Tax=Bacillus sp. HMF5848 TaxID=2495421 RepID=UPI000F7A701D|nr:hypothetical protein [Bacillus sp. HMF5848]RSK26629.1 hypothetical protein EJF36_07015 [Bacillus sp. HMF5848]
MTENKEVHAQEPANEKMEQQAHEERLTSLDLLWQHILQEIDAWAARADFRDEVLLKAVHQYAEGMKRSQENVQKISETFMHELRSWEKTAREEFLMSTTAIQHFFPIKSYEEVNEVFDSIQERTAKLIATPFKSMSERQSVEKYIETLQHYMQIRKQSRDQYVANMKQTARLVYESQKGFVDLFTNQLKAIIFPFEKYMEKYNEPGKEPVKSEPVKS